MEVPHQYEQQFLVAKTRRGCEFLRTGNLFFSIMPMIDFYGRSRIHKTEFSQALNAVACPPPCENTEFHSLHRT